MLPKNRIHLESCQFDQRLSNKLQEFSEFIFNFEEEDRFGFLHAYLSQ